MKKVDVNFEKEEKKHGIYRSSTTGFNLYCKFIKHCTLEIKNTKSSSYSTENLRNNFGMNTENEDTQSFSSQNIGIESFAKSNKKFNLPQKILKNFKNEDQNQTLEESFNALDSPDFMIEYKEEEKKELKKIPSIFFKRGGSKNILNYSN